MTKSNDVLRHLVEEYLKEHLEISITKEDGYHLSWNQIEVVVSLKLKGEEISSKYITITEGGGHDE